MIQIEGLCKQFPGTHAWALDGIHLQVEEGEVVGLLGENAAGKNHAFKKVVAGLMEPTRGKVTIDATPSLKAAGQVAFMTEQGTLFFPL